MKNEKLRLIVLIPHRDSIQVLADYKRQLLRNAFFGAYSFPSVIPLMITKKPYTLAELKETAVFLKKMIYLNNKDAKFVSQEAEIVELLPQTRLGGLSFPISLNTVSIKKDDVPFPRFLLGLTVLNPRTEASFLPFTKDHPVPSISFTACSAANMMYQYSENSVCSWEIGHPIWLPKSNFLP